MKIKPPYKMKCEGESRIYTFQSQVYNLLNDALQVRYRFQVIIWRPHKEENEEYILDVIELCDYMEITLNLLGKKIELKDPKLSELKKLAESVSGLLGIDIENEMNQCFDDNIDKKFCQKYLLEKMNIKVIIEE
jgi:hypothetical protein